MNDIDALLEAADNLRQRKMSAALATLVEVRGAAFRRIGVRMLIDENGGTTGAVTAGCIESDIVEKAKDVLLTGTPAVIHYDTGSEKEILFGWGSGCDGVLTVLVEKLDLADNNGLMAYLAVCTANREPAIIATVYAGKTGVDSHAVGTRLFGAEALSFLPKSEAGSAAATAISELIELGGADLHVLVERIVPPDRMIIFGSGAVSAPLARFADELAWRVTVVDKHPLSDRPQGFPFAVEVVSAPYESIADHISFDQSTAAVITTHNFLDDVALVKILLASRVRTISLLSSRRRAAKVIEYLEESSGALAPSDRARLFAPAGLDLGGDTPAHIAFSIVAQLQQIFTESTSQSLRDKLPS
jgi:xanthine/CO dehydrogenase XdhC/CoxF family maturation factor